MNVPNPFKLIDYALLDYVFNPLSWWSEYRFGKDAMDLRLVSSYIGSGGVAFMAVQEKIYVLIFLTAVLLSIDQITFSQRRHSWVKSNTTGKNIQRLRQFSMRMFNIGMTLLLVFTPSAATSEWGSDIIGTIGFFIVLVVTSYFDATDAMPPSYRQTKTAVQFM